MANEMNPVGWFEIYVRDMERAKSFYETVLGVKAIRNRLSVVNTQTAEIFTENIAPEIFSLPPNASGMFPCPPGKHPALAPSSAR